MCYPAVVFSVLLLHAAIRDQYPLKKLFLIELELPKLPDSCYNFKTHG